MADATKQVEIRLLAKDETKGAFESAARGAETAQTSFKSMAGAVALGQAAFAIAAKATQEFGRFLSGCVENALADERAMTMLNGTIKRTGVDLQSATAAFDAQSQAAVKMGFASEATAAVQSKFLGIIKDVGETTKLTALAMDIARAKNMDFETASQAVQRVLLGGGAAARKFGFAVEETATNVEALNKIQKEVGSTASDFAKSEAGAVLVAQTAWEELKSTLGKKFLPVLTTLANYMTAVATDPRMDAFLTKVGDTVTGYVVPAIVWLANTLGSFGKYASEILRGFSVEFGLTGDQAANEVNWIGKTLGGLLKVLGTGMLTIAAGAKLVTGVFVSFGLNIASVAANIWNGVIDTIQHGLDWVAKKINTVLSGYDMVSKALGGKGMSTRIAFDFSKDKIGVDTISALKSASSDTFNATIKQVQSDWSKIGDFVLQDSKSTVWSDAGKAAADAWSKPFDAGKLALVAKDPTGGAAGKAAEALKKDLEAKLYALKQFGESIKKTIADCSAKTKEWNEITDAVTGAFKDVGAQLSKAGIQVQGLTDRTDVLKQSHKETINSLITGLKSYASEAEATKGKIADLTLQIAQLKADEQSSLGQNSADVTRSSAEKIVELQNQLSEAQKSVQSGTLSSSDLDKTIKEIAALQVVLEKQVDFIKANSSEIKRAQDLANADEITKIRMLGAEKAAQIKKEYEEKIAAAEKEKNDLQEKYASELDMLKQYTAAINIEWQVAKADYAKYLIDSETQSNAHIASEIARYNQLAAAIRNASKGQSSTFTPEQNTVLDAYKNGVPKMATGGIVTRPTMALIGESGPEAVIPLGKDGIVPSINVLQGATVSVSGQADERRLAKSIAAEIARTLQSQRRGLATQL